MGHIIKYLICTCVYMCSLFTWQKGAVCEVGREGEMGHWKDTQDSEPIIEYNISV